MPKIHNLEYEDKFIQEKVNFSADYYHFVVDNIDLYDELEIENYLSLTKKILFQVESNSKNCPKYLEVYFSNPLLKKNNKYFQEFRSYNSLQPLISKYQRASEKKKWIEDNHDFLLSLKSFKRELERSMFKKALDDIASFLKCPHNIHEHLNDLKHYTNILVSELLLRNKDAEKVFDRILSERIGHFPFPKNIESLKDDNSVESKKEYLANRTFDQQLEGIYHILRENARKQYFLFRIEGIEATPDFKFKYNRVTFYHPKHSKLAELKGSEVEPGPRDFFSGESMLIAVVKVGYFKINLAKKEAKILIKEELAFLNHVCQANATLEEYTYLNTTNFKSITGFGSDHRKRGVEIGCNEEEMLNDNPYRLFKNVNKKCRDHVLKHEPLFIRAVISESMQDYWHYLETRIPRKKNNNKDENQVIDIVSTILVLNSESVNKSRIRNYILDITLFFPTPLETLNITTERVAYFKNQYSEKKLDLPQLSKEINHPFLNYLFKIHDKKYSKDRLEKTIRKHYSRLLWELQAQRNAIIHSGYGNEEALIQLSRSIPNLISRLRWVIFNGMERHKDASFEELIIRLKEEAVNKLSV